MNTTEFYLPLLKSKAGEFEALYKLLPHLKSKIVPLFEVTPLEFDHDTNKKPKTLEEHLINFCKKIVGKWPTNDCFLDTHFIDGQKVNGIECLEFIYGKLALKNILPMPIIRISMEESLIGLVANIIEENSIEDIGIRVTIDDITASSFGERLEALLNSIDKTEENCHIILDLAESDFTNKEDFADAILDELKNFQSLDGWKSFTLVGGAFPGMAKIKSDLQIIPRSDWKFYQHFKNKFLQQNFYRTLNYGDYSIVSPGYFEYDPRKMSRSANIRYTIDDNWLVVKGRALKVSTDWQQYHDQAKKIVESGYYLGENYSDGDYHIKKCAERKTKTGNSNTWMKVGNNHHFTKIINDLFSMNP